MANIKCKGTLDVEGKVFIGQEETNGIQLGKNGRICATKSDGTEVGTMCGIDGNNTTLLGNAALQTKIRGSQTRPTYNDKEIALKEDVEKCLPLAGGTLTGSLGLKSSASETTSWTISVEGNNVYFKYNNVAKMKLTTEGQLDVLSVNLVSSIS